MDDDAIDMVSFDAVMTKADDENFPVSPWFLPAATRVHLLAFYGYARLVDDLGDELRGDRLAALEEVDRELDRIYCGETPRHPLLQRLARTVATLGIPELPLRALVEANRIDQRQTRYATLSDLLDYCALSANPVGELVLRAFDVATGERLRYANAICSGLQIVNFAQDISEDYSRGRVYVPQEYLARFDCRERSLAASSADRSVVSVVEALCVVAADLLDQGAPLVGTLRGRARLTTAGFVAGGRDTIRAIRHVRHDVLARHPRRGRLSFARTAARRV